MTTVADDLRTPALLVDLAAFDHNVATMAERWPGRRLRPHVKAFKSTALARRLTEEGHLGFCCATIREMEGMAAAGLGDDLLLANEVLHADRLGALVRAGHGITVAVDSDATIQAAARGGVGRVLIDVNVGLPRCGCPPDDAERLSDVARIAGLEVRGVMGYEGHLMSLADPVERAARTASCMAILADALTVVGGTIASGGGTGTWDCNHVVTELQAGSYTLMDTTYDGLGLPFRRALSVLGTVVSRNPQGYAVADVGLKALGMDHGDPTIDGYAVWFCSDEHVTFAPTDDGPPLPRVGDLIEVWPAHVDPTVAYHEQLHVIERAPAPSSTTATTATTATTGSGAPIAEARVLDRWPVDLRGW